MLFLQLIQLGIIFICYGTVDICIYMTLCLFGKPLLIPLKGAATLLLA